MRRNLILMAIASTALGLSQMASAEQIQIAPSKDNTLYEDDTGALSNGLGSGIFMGRTSSSGDDKLRRAVIAFDLSAIPANALIDSVSVTFTINKIPLPFNNPSDGTAWLHRLSQDWGEGTSDPGFSNGGQGEPAEPGDATWIHRFYDTDNWSAAGGDFVGQASASTAFSTGEPETIVFADTAGLRADVQSWVSDPAQNFGWILIGDESLNANARRLASREETDGTHPVLTVDYRLPSVLDNLELNLLTDELQDPVSAANAGDGSGRLFIVEQRGVIRVYDLATDTLLATPFLDIQDEVFSLVDSGGGNEQGLLGLAFHPDYPVNGKFYVNYTASPSVGQWQTVVAEYLVSGDANVAESTGQVIMQFQQDARNHNGGDLHFGADGYLYIASGDGGGSGDQYDNAQNLDTLTGAMLRIDVDGTAAPGAELCGVNADYGIPATNPFTGTDDGCDEILHFGLRNPWRFSFDAMTEELWIADVGQNVWEEVNLVQPGETGVNFGWSCREGAHPFGGSACISAYTDPVIEYDHSGSRCSVTGGYVYRGANLPLNGRYLYGDWCTAQVWIATLTGGVWVSEEWATVSATLNSLASFAQDENCNLYLIDRDAEPNNGALYRIDDSEYLFDSGFERRNCR